MWLPGINWGHMIDRRAFVVGVLAAPFAAPQAHALGLPAGPDAYGVLGGAAALAEGKGSGTINIIFTPWCSAVPSMFAATRSVLETVKIRWIPYSGGMPEGKEATEILLRNPNPSLIPASLVAMHHGDTRQATPLCDEQDAYVARVVEPVIVRDAGGSMKIPTLVYRIGGDRVRLVGGTITNEDIARIAALAS